MMKKPILRNLGNREKQHATKLYTGLKGKFLCEIKTPQRVIDGTSILLKHFPPGKILDIGSGQAEVYSLLAKSSQFECYCCDDFSDPWHLEIGKDKMISNIEERNIKVKTIDSNQAKLPFNDNEFTGIFCCDMIEHLHFSPRPLLQEIYRMLKPNGVVAIGMPNSVNLRKRIDVLCGRTNYVPLNQFWSIESNYRGHIREYTPFETWQILAWADFKPSCIYMMDWQVMHRLQGLTLAIYKQLSRFFLGARDSYIAIAHKPQ